MTDINDLELLLQSRVPVIVVETHEEIRVVEMFVKLSISMMRPVFRWTSTKGLLRLDIDDTPMNQYADPASALAHVAESSVHGGIYLFLDIHPFLSDPMLVRRLREVAQTHNARDHTVVLVSHDLELPPEIQSYCARFNLALPDKSDLVAMVKDIAREWASKNQGRKVKTSPHTLELLVKNLSGLSLSDARRLARNVIFDDGAIKEEDIPEVMEAKYKLFNENGVLAFEKDIARVSEVAGLANLKQWLEQRRAVFHDENNTKGLDKPRGILLLGVQGCGKSLAARAVAGLWGLPLLRLDFGALYNKYIGETEKNLREALRLAEVMAPCVLWADEIEKGVSGGGEDSGVSKRVLGTLLTWMSDQNPGVFIVATANDISALPPELIRKGRMDEIFFVDLPDRETRATIFSMQLKKRALEPKQFDLEALASASEEFSGAEIEQAVVSALYSALAAEKQITTELILKEIGVTRPLSVVMSEQVGALRQWAASRTVPAG